MFSVSRSGEACAVCAAADPTLPVAGAESAFKGRFRVTTDARAMGRVALLIASYGF